MWDGVTYVDPVRNPIISEGGTPSRLIILIAGPSSVAVQCWENTKPSSGDAPNINIELWPENTCSVSGNLVRASLLEHRPHHTYEGGVGPAPFAAIGWKIVS